MILSFHLALLAYGNANISSSGTRLESAALWGLFLQVHESSDVSHRAIQSEDATEKFISSFSSFADDRVNALFFHCLDACNNVIERLNDMLEVDGEEGEEEDHGSNVKKDKDLDDDAEKWEHTECKVRTVCERSWVG